MIAKWTVVAAAGVMLGLIGGCKRDNARSTTTTTGGTPTDDTRVGREDFDREYNRGYNLDREHRIENRGGAVSNRFDSEVQRLSSARCERELRCNNVGNDRKFVSRDQCLSKIGNDLREELNAWDCKGGIDTKELEECLTEIRNEDCGNPLDTVGRLVACRSGDMCKAMP
jgi:hypothetical protein